MKQKTIVAMLQKGAAVLVAAAALAGCGGSGGGVASTEATSTGTVTTTAGTTAAQLTVAAPAGVTLSIPSGTTLTDASGTPVTGTVTTSVSYSTTASDLPAEAATLPAGTSLAGFANIVMGTVKNFSQPVALTMNVAGVSAGDIVELYSFSGSAWKYEGQQSVSSTGTISPAIQHLSIWAALKAGTLHPAPPTGAAATAGDKQVTLTWNAVTGATSYNIYYGTSAGVTAANGTKVAASTTTGAVTPLTNGTKYYFGITAVNAAGESVVSSELSATPVPTKPAGIIASAGDAQVTVTWTTVAGLSYNLYYSTTQGGTAGGTKIANATAPTTISGLTNGTPYYVTVTAVENGVESGPSSEKTATPAAAPVPPGSPTGTVATAGTGSVTYSWNAVPTATSYNVYYLQQSGSTAPTASTVLATGTKVTTTATSTTISGLSAGLPYYFNVTAANAGGESGTQSNAKKATPL